MTLKSTTLILALLALTAGAASALTYTSVPGGGNWNESATWSPAGVPSAGDDAIVASNVVITADHTCLNLTVEAGATLTNNFSHRTLAVSGDVVNDGTITDTNYQIRLHVAGDLTNRGTLAIWRVRFTGAGLPHTLTHEGAGDLMSDNLELEAGTGPLTLQGGLNTGATINLNGGQLICAPGADVIMTAGQIQDGAVDAAGNAFDLTDGVFFWNVTLADPVLRGHARVYSGCIMTGTVVNEGVLENRAFTHVDLVVDGDLENHGTVTSSNYLLKIDISGDILNQGVWDNNRVTFTGAGAAHALTSSGGTTFVPQLIQLEAGTGVLTLTTPTTFSSEVDLNAGRIVCAPGADLTLLSGFVQDGELDAAGNAVDAVDGVYLWNLLVEDPVLRGVVQLYSGVTLAGTVVVEGELKNRDFTHADAVVDGDLENRGAITSTNYTLDLDITGDVFNDGVWTNNTVRFTGAGTPHAYTQTAGKSIAPNRLELAADTGPLSVDSPMTVGGIFDLNGGQVNCAPGADITLLSGYMQEGGLDAAGNDLTLTEGVYLWNLQVDDPVLRGTVEVYSGVTMTGAVVVQDTLRNRDFTHADLVIAGDLTNHGLITSTNWTLELFISGNAHNAGVWENYRTHFDGTDDQFILVDDAHPLGDDAVFVSHLSGGSYQWTQSSVPVQGATAATWIAGPLDESSYGQYRCTDGTGGQSRWIHVSPYFDTTAAPEAPAAAAVFALERNRPNPFNPKTEIAFSLPEAGRVDLAVYDLKGRRVRTLIDGVRGAGRHVAEWSGNDDADRQVSAGVYFGVLRSPQGVLTRKLTLLP